uniref:Uncharacterized protein n=1 Tax=Salix viminalis TaxID=40686 RepID=A0A6N2MTD1_SALVM
MTERGWISFSTKKLEPTPGDMIHSLNIVLEKVEKMAHTFGQGIAFLVLVSAEHLFQQLINERRKDTFLASGNGHFVPSDRETA